MVQVKTCGKCKGDLPIEQFSKDKNAKDGHQAWCKTCTSIYKAALYAEGEAFSYLYLGGKCSHPECTCTDWDMITIHHLDELLKTKNTSNYFAKAHKRLVEELNKCVLLCGNHHLKIHALQKRNANAEMYQKVISLTSKHRGVKTPADRRRPHSVERACQL